MTDPTVVDTIGDSVSDVHLEANESFRSKLYRLLHSHRFQVVIVVLVIIDCLLVITELLIDLELLQVKSGDSKSKQSDGSHDNVFVTIIHACSLTILSLFLVEILAKVYAYRLALFRHKLELFDAFVVIVSFALDVHFHTPQSAAANGWGLIVMLRLWRVARLLNGIVVTVKKQAEHRLEKEVKLREVLLQELLQNRDYCNALEQDNAYLRELLTKNGITAPPAVAKLNSSS